MAAEDADRADHMDLLAAIAGVQERPRSRALLDEALADAVVESGEVEETNVVELAAFVDQANRGLR